MSYSITQGSTASDTTRIGSHGAITPGTPDAVITFPQATGTTSLGQSMVASGIITMSGGNTASSGSATVNGLTVTDVVITSISTDASGSSRFFVKVDAATDAISSVGYTLSGSSFAHCHYVVYRTI